MWKSIRREGWERIWGPWIYLGHLEEEEGGGGPAENAVTWRFLWEKKRALPLWSKADPSTGKLWWLGYKWFYSRWIFITASIHPSIHPLDALLFHTRLHFLRCKITSECRSVTLKVSNPVTALRTDACLIINKSCGIIALLVCSCSFSLVWVADRGNIWTGGWPSGRGRYDGFMLGRNQILISLLQEKHWIVHFCI